MLATKQKFDLEQQATLLFNEDEIPFTPQEWQQLEDLLAKSEYQHIVGGDSNESHSVWVSRYYNDVESPEALNSLSEEIAAIVMSSKMRAFYQQFTGTDKLCLRRCQANRLQKGDYIGVHKDQDSSPDYFATVVFHFSENYSGGYFQTLEQSAEHAEERDQEDRDRASANAQRYKPRAHMALVNNCSIPHQVTKVKNGDRLTLACFLSTSFAPNTATPAAFKINKQNRLISPS